MSLIKKLIFKCINYFLNFHQNFIYGNFREKYSIEESFRFNRKEILLYGEAEIFFGKNSYVGEYSTWQSSRGYKISIGEGCMISHNVRCYTQSNDANFDFSKKDIPSKLGNVVIGNNVWIEANVFINPGIIIGDNAVVGAHSVVTKNIEPYSIVGGVPAILLRFKTNQS